MSQTTIEVKHLQKYYGKHMGVEDVSLRVEKGEIFGFLGSNGAGKSTTIRCLLGLIRPSRGEITLLGKKDTVLAHELNQYRLYALRSSVLSFYEGKRPDKVSSSCPQEGLFQGS